MNKQEEIKRRIELKQQLIQLTVLEIKALRKVLENQAGDRLITENQHSGLAAPVK